MLLDAGADVDACDKAEAGDTPLAEVAGRCSPEIAELLIANGADPTIPGWMQLTALDRAASRERPEGRRVFEILQEAARS
jgi:ankyrin repeat protein